ncbi:MAG: glycosyltransferase [Clostridiaceae bacterium]|nr:glycosyltransferase [Clostridiaceae bacterium]
MKLDIIIPTYRPGEQLEELLKRLLKQELLPDRIIIMNTEEELWDAERFESLFDGSPVGLTVQHLSREAFDHGGTRHRGILLSDADVCLCMTQDAIPYDRKLTGKLVEAVSSSDRIAAAYARQLPAADCGPVERYTRQFNYPEQSRVKGKEDLEELGIKTYFCSNVCAAYVRERYLELGGFTRKTIFNEDMIFAGHAVQAGYRIAYAADAQVIHSHNYSAMEQLHRNFDLAVSQADHPEVFAGVRSEGEGIRLVKQTAVWLVKTGRFWLVPDLVLKSGFKYAGYLLGKNYRKLPRPMVLWLTMNRAYWKE